MEKRRSPNGIVCIVKYEQHEGLAMEVGYFNGVVIYIKCLKTLEIVYLNEVLELEV